jgi:hypothetical protein
MQGFMPGTQPRGTHAFDPGSLSSQSAAQALNAVNTEEDGAEDQFGPPLDSPMANVPAAPDASSLDPFGLTASSSSSFGEGSFIVPSIPPPDSHTSSAGSTRPPSSSSLPQTVYSRHDPTQRDISMGSSHSAHSITTGTGSASDAGSSQFRKRKHDAGSLSGIRPPNSKRASKSKTDDLNPVIISNALNSTLNRIADVMERTLDATATTAPPSVASVAPPSIVVSPIELQTPINTLSTPSNPLSASASSAEILDQAIRIISADDRGLSEDELFLASLFFTSASEDAVRAARTFIALGNNRAVQHRFLLRQLDTAALLPGRGKAKAVEDDDHFMVY